MIYLDSSQSLRYHMVRHWANTRQKHPNLHYPISQFNYQTASMSQSSFCSSSLVKNPNSILAPSNFTLIWKNHDFKSNKQPLKFHTWAEKGITHLNHIFPDNTLVSFPHLAQQHGIRSNQHLHRLQLKSSSQSKMNIKNANLFLPATIANLVIKSWKKTPLRMYKIILHSMNPYQSHQTNLNKTLSSLSMSTSGPISATTCILWCHPTDDTESLIGIKDSWSKPNVLDGPGLSCDNTLFAK